MRKTKRYAECIWIESESKRTRRISETGDKRKQITKQKKREREGVNHIKQRKRKLYILYLLYWRREEKICEKRNEARWQKKTSM